MLLYLLNQSLHFTWNKFLFYWNRNLNCLDNLNYYFNHSVCLSFHLYIWLQVCHNLAFIMFMSSGTLSVQHWAKQRITTYISKEHSHTCSQAVVCTGTPRKQPRSGYILVEFWNILLSLCPKMHYSKNHWPRIWIKCDTKTSNLSDFKVTCT